MNQLFESQIAPYATTMEDKRPELQPIPGAPQPHTLTSYERQVFAEAGQAFQEWQASDEGKAQWASFGQMSASEIITALEGLLKSSYFDKTVALLSVPPIIEDSGFQTFSIAAVFEAAIIVGFNGSLGVAVGLTELAANPQADRSGLGGVGILSLGFDFEVGGGALLGVEFGLWKSAPTDMGGFSTSAILYVDDELGGGVGATFTMDYSSLLGVSLTMAAGLDDGLDVWNPSYTFVIGHTDMLFPPIIQTPASHFLILTKLYCSNISGGDGDHNEIFFLFQPDGGTTYPYPSWDYFAMAEGDTWYCGRSVLLNNQVVINLYDSDGTSNNDLLGTTTIYAKDLVVGQEKAYSISSKNGLDERSYTIYAKLIY